jgi:transcriptional antiterminator RfaH
VRSSKSTASAWRCYLPRIRSQRATGLRKAVTALFPGYAFVLIQLQWHAARWSPGVLRLVLDGVQPAKVPDKVITELKGREKNGLVVLPSPSGFRHGDPVRITRGVFAGQLAVFDGMRPHERVAVLLQLLGKVELAKVDIALAPD